MGGAVKVYGVAASPFVATVLLCLEETGVGYELVPVDMAAREQRTESYLSRNVRTQAACLNLRFRCKLTVRCNQYELSCMHADLS
jgi:hypothetical protein